MVTLHLVPGDLAPSGRARPLPRGGSGRAVRRGEAPLRLTRRGRAVVRAGVGLLLSLVVVAAVLLLVRPALAGTDVSPASLSPVSVRYHVVLPGETLLQIAAEEVPGVDPRDTAARIIDLNELRGSMLDAGQRLALPPSD